MISYTPDYPADTVPIWQIPFPIKPGNWHQIRGALNELMETQWQQNNAPSIGGAQEWVVIETVESQVRIPTNLISNQEVTVAEVYQQIRLIVPSVIWEELDLRRARYWTENLME